MVTGILGGGHTQHICYIAKNQHLNFKTNDSYQQGTKPSNQWGLIVKVSIICAMVKSRVFWGMVILPLIGILIMGPYKPLLLGWIWIIYVIGWQSIGFVQDLSILKGWFHSPMINIDPCNNSEANMMLELWQSCEGFIHFGACILKTQYERCCKTRRFLMCKVQTPHNYQEIYCKAIKGMPRIVGILPAMFQLPVDSRGIPPTASQRCPTKGTPNVKIPAK